MLQLLTPENSSRVAASGLKERVKQLKVRKDDHPLEVHGGFWEVRLRHVIAIVIVTSTMNEHCNEHEYGYYRMLVQSYKACILYKHAEAEADSNWCIGVQRYREQ